MHFQVDCSQRNFVVLQDFCAQTDFITDLECLIRDESLARWPQVFGLKMHPLSPKNAPTQSCSTASLPQNALFQRIFEESSSHGQFFFTGADKGRGARRKRCKTTLAQLLTCLDGHQANCKTSSKRHSLKEVWSQTADKYCRRASPGKLDTTTDFARSLNHNGASTSLSCCVKLCQKNESFYVLFFVKFEIVCDEKPSCP